MSRWPRVLLVAAALVVLGRGACAGFGGYVAALFGTAAGDGALLGLAYVATHFAFVILAPILAFAGCLGVALHRRL